jgi:hypothetical protein
MTAAETGSRMLPLKKILTDVTSQTRKLAKLPNITP